ncbi:MFS transporter [Streptomyces pimonensis]|uniref:MFS transporter n=1 Tax=Streptomyces pimonensis TaxID=2860288 RepID=A0ABV4JAW5_9ACTN
MTTRSNALPPAPADRLRPGSWALPLVLAGNMLLDALEVSTVLVALPTMVDALGISLWTAQWLMTGFALGFALLLLSGRKVTARWGRRRAYLTALGVFALASVIGGLTDSALLLIATRVVKGACAALTVPIGLAIITTSLRDEHEQRRAVSLYAFLGAAGFSTGVLLAGALTPASWRWTFLLPALAASALLVPAHRLVPRDMPEGPVGGAGGTMRPPLLRNGPFIRSALAAATLNGTYLSMLLVVVPHGQTQLGWSPWECALALLPACLPPVAATPFAARMVAACGTRRLVALGAMAALAGYGLLLRHDAPRSYLTDVLPTLALLGLAFVLSFAALNMQAVSEVPARARPVAVPLYQTAVQGGAALMLPAVALLLSGDGGTRPAVVLVVAVGALGAAVALLGRGGGARPGEGPRSMSAGEADGTPERTAGDADPSAPGTA